MKKEAKSQAALEFLMTYGWVIMVVLVSIGALAYFGVLGPDKFVPRRCALEPGIGCRDFKVQEDAVTLVLMNGKGEDVTITSIKVGSCAGTTTGSLKNAVEIFESNGRGAKVFLKEVHDPSRYGVATIQDQSVTEIEEKPSQPKSNYAVIGYYLFDEKVFDIISKIKPSERGEYEITDVNNEYIKLGELSYEILNGEWTDAGTFESLLYANKILMPEEKSPYLVSQEQVGKMIDEIESKLAELRKHQRL